MQARQVNRAAHALPLPVPAPVGGLNLLSPLAAMPPGDASVMSNFFPYADKVGTRAGYTTLVTAPSITQAATVEGFTRLMLHVGGGTETAFGAFYYSANNAGTNRTRIKVYSISTTGVLVDTLTYPTLTDEITCIGEWTQFTSSAGTSYCMFVTAIHTTVPVHSTVVYGYDGTSWAALAVTGLPEIVQGIHSHQKRVWFYGCDSIGGTPKPLSAFYLPTGAVAGAVVEFNLGPFASKGGRIVSMRTWMLDNGEGGTDDVAVFLTDQGQMLVYQGTDPSSAATWRLIGTFDVGKLAGFASASRSGGNFSIGGFVKDSFAMKYGNDVVVMSQAGLTSVEKIVGGSIDPLDYSLSYKVNPDFSTYAQLSLPYSANWKMTFVPSLQHFLICTPTGYASGGATVLFKKQYVMNSQTRAWTTYDFSGFDDTILVGGAIYGISLSSSAGSRVVRKFDGTALDDAGAAITYECRQAYNYLGSPTNKSVPLMQPMLSAAGAFTMTLQADADFNGGSIATYTAYSAGINQPWLSANKFGRAIASHIQGTVAAGMLTWYATNFVYVNSGSLV